jgi:hypothetical protein
MNREVHVLLRVQFVPAQIKFLPALPPLLTLGSQVRVLLTKKQIRGSGTGLALRGVFVSFMALLLVVLPP